MILLAALGATLLLILVFYRGQKTNLAFAHQVALLLETLTQPEAVKYLWLGGVLGFQALYHRPRRLGHRDLKVTLLLLPRHTLLYLPIAWWRHRGDRILLTLHGPVSLPESPPPGLHPLLRRVDKESRACTVELRLPRNHPEPVLRSLIQWLASCS